MAWNKGWDQIFKDNEWGKYPPEELIRFVARTFRAVPAEKRKDIRILEVGCGTGANLWYLAREGFSAFGMDGSKIALERAKKRFKKEKLKAVIKDGDILSLPFKGDYFDCVIDVECIYANSMKDSKIILNEIKRVLKPGGYLFSKTFMTGTYGDGLGRKMPGENNTYLELSEGALHKGYGIIRFTSEQDIQELYSVLQIKNIDHIIRSEKGRQYEVKEWVITCQK